MGQTEKQRAALRRRSAAPWSMVLLAGGLLAASAHIHALEVNQASQAELERLRGIGPALSDQLIEQRAQRPFTDWDDLQRRVRGLGAALARRLSAAGLRVDGQRFERAPEGELPSTKPAASAPGGRMPG